MKVTTGYSIDRTDSGYTVVKYGSIDDGATMVPLCAVKRFDSEQAAQAYIESVLG